MEKYLYLLNFHIFSCSNYKLWCTLLEPFVKYQHVVALAIVKENVKNVVGMAV